MKIWNPENVVIGEQKRITLKKDDGWFHVIKGVKLDLVENTVSVRFVTEPVISIEKHLTQTVVWISFKERYLVIDLRRQWPLLKLYILHKEISNAEENIT